MSVGHKIFRTAPRLLTDTIRAVVGASLQRAMARSGMSQSALAERLGKSDRKSAADYLAGNTTMDLTAFLSGCADEELGDEFGNDVLALIGRKLCPTTVDAVPVDKLAQDLSGFLAALLKAWSDRKLTPGEKVALGKMVRPLICELQSVVAAADAVTG
jgi:transcriptional regulator with XRE-family HTH domain